METRSNFNVSIEPKGTPWLSKHSNTLLLGKACIGSTSFVRDVTLVNQGEETVKIEWRSCPKKGKGMLKLKLSINKISDYICNDNVKITSPKRNYEVNSSLSFDNAPVKIHPESLILSAKSKRTFQVELLDMSNPGMFESKLIAYVSKFDEDEYRSKLKLKNGHNNESNQFDLAEFDSDEETDKPTTQVIEITAAEIIDNNTTPSIPGDPTNEYGGNYEMMQISTAVIGESTLKDAEANQLQHYNAVNAQPHNGTSISKQTIDNVTIAAAAQMNNFQTEPDEIVTPEVEVDEIVIPLTAELFYPSIIANETQIKITTQDLCGVTIPYGFQLNLFVSQPDIFNMKSLARSLNNSATLSSTTNALSNKTTNAVNTNKSFQKLVELTNPLLVNLDFSIQLEGPFELVSASEKDDISERFDDDNDENSDEDETDFNETKFHNDSGNKDTKLPTSASAVSATTYPPTPAAAKLTKAEEKKVIDEILVKAKRLENERLLAASKVLKLPKSPSASSATATFKKGGMTQTLLSTDVQVTPSSAVTAAVASQGSSSSSTDCDGGILPESFQLTPNVRQS